jgi:hypothetical protein
VLICYSLGSAAQSGCSAFNSIHEVGKRQRPFWVPSGARENLDHQLAVFSVEDCWNVNESIVSDSELSLRRLATRRVSNENFDRHRTSQ